MMRVGRRPLRAAAALLLAAAAGAGSGIGTSRAQQGSATAESCTDQWLRHGHTNQSEAKAFARTCLAAAGAIAATLDAADVSRRLASVLDADHPLTRIVPIDSAAFCPRYGRL